METTVYSVYEGNRFLWDIVQKLLNSGYTYWRFPDQDLFLIIVGADQSLGQKLVKKLIDRKWKYQWESIMPEGWRPAVPDPVLRGEVILSSDLAVNVAVDDNEIGKTPLKLDLEEGVHTVTFENPSKTFYTTVQKTVEVKAGTSIQVKQNFKLRQWKRFTPYIKRT